MTYDDEMEDFNNWCANYFGPDSDEQYVLDAVRKCPIVERLQSRIEALEKDAERRKEVLHMVLEKKGKRWHLCDPVVDSILDACEDTAMQSTNEGEK